MGTVLRFDGLRVMINPNDHHPANVHVIGGGQVAVFRLHCPNGPPELRDNYKPRRGGRAFNVKELTRIKAVLAENLTVLCSEWEEIHGYY